MQRFEERGFKLVALKFVQPTTQLLEQHYADLKGKPFFPGLVQYMSSGPVVPMVTWHGVPRSRSPSCVLTMATPGRAGVGGAQRRQDGPEDARRDKAC